MAEKRHTGRDYLWRRDDGYEIKLGRLEKIEPLMLPDGTKTDITLLTFATPPGVRPLQIPDEKRVVEVKATGGIKRLFGGKS